MPSLNRRAAAALIGGFVTALVFLVPTSLQGDDWNLATRFTINHQFEVPGAILEANTPYVMRLYDSPSERNVVQVLNEDQTKLLTMFIAIRSERMQPTDDTKFSFMESAPGFPLPIKEWFYPGRLTGREFLYPKDQLERIAGYRTRAVTTQVAVAEPVVEEQESVEIAQAEPIPEPVAELAPEPVESEAIEAESEAVQIAQADLPSEHETPAEPAVSEGELPRTASELPLVGLIGLLCLGAGLGIKGIRTNN